MIEIHNLLKQYPGAKSPVLKDIHLTFPDTGLFYLVGKSGAGKSTLINLLGCMDDHYEGSIKVNNKELKEQSEIEKANYRLYTISFVFQSYHAEEKETVYMNLSKALAITSLTQEEKDRRIHQRLKEVGLLHKEQEIFKNLSGGEKKRISLARSLIKDYQILLCDEPLSSLNPKLRKDITKLLEKESKNKLVIIITHEKEEIPKEATIYELINGNLHLIKEGKREEKKATSIHYQRKKFTGSPFIRQLLESLKTKREFLVITLFSLMFALFSISLSFQLSGSVSLAMEKSMSAYMDENSLVVSNADNGYKQNGFTTADYAQLEYLKNTYKEDVIDTSSFYLTSLDSIFEDNQSLQLNYQSRSLELKKLSLDSFLEYRMLEEVDGKEIYGNSKVSPEEVILGLDDETIYGLYILLFEKKPKSINEETLELIAKGLNRSNTMLRLQALKSDWGYDLDHSFKINAIIQDESCYIVNSSSLFANTFVTDVMHFKECLEEEPLDKQKPWALRKCEGFRLYPGHSDIFLKNFLFDKTTHDYSLKMMQEDNYYKQEDINTHNHVALVKDCLGKIHLDEINSFALSHQEDVENISYSSPVYTYTASGYISGFAKPFFFSKYKEKLNQIEDEAYYSSEDLGSFQGSLIEEIPGVIKADLISSMDQKNGLTFITLNHSSLKPYYGKAPTAMNEIGISKKMATTLFHSCTQALNKKLCTLTLDKTEKVNGKYHNHFLPGEVLITGIYDSDHISIYQDSLFPLCYCFANGGLNAIESRVQQAVIKVNLEHHSLDYYLSEIKKCGDYNGAFPMYTMIQEIKKTLSFLSLLFLSFATLSLITAVMLLSLSFYLILLKDRKQIGILLALGYTKRDIAHFYMLFCQIIGFLSFILSLFISIFTEQILQKTLNDMLNSYIFSLTPFIISFMVSFSITSVIGLIISKKLGKFAPNDVFEHAHG
jgi:ABC-type lipoprotein export system ATPase subunit